MQHVNLKHHLLTPETPHSLAQGGRLFSSGRHKPVHGASL